MRLSRLSRWVIWYLLPLENKWPVVKVRALSRSSENSEDFDHLRVMIIMRRVVIMNSRMKHRVQ
jgi:hypothetical protein